MSDTPADPRTQAQADDSSGESRPAERPSPPPAPSAPPRTRTSAAFKSLVAAAIVLILLLVFILENTQSVKISYFGASGHMPLGVALLLAAAGGALLIAVVGTLRITQLRRHSKRQRRQ
jgi:uncharacterized integral membrane protein